MITSHVHVWDPGHRALTIGLILGVTVVAFELLAVVTVAPKFAEALDGLSLYGWVFSANLLASLLSTVLSGSLADRRGPGLPFFIGLGLFAAGLFTSGFAPTMEVLIAGRVLQGLGGGALITSMYVVMNLAYPDHLRPRMMALTSSAWVLPALVGPAGAGLLAEALSWRWVFLGVVPIVALTGALTISAFGRIELPVRTTAERKVAGLATLLVAGTGVLLYGLENPNGWLGITLIALGAVAISRALPRLLPDGALRFVPGLPALISTRGLFFAAFNAVEIFMALMLTNVHGYSSTVTGFVIATGAISWTGGSWVQDRWDKATGPSGRPDRVVLGTSLLSVGLALQLVALYSPFVPLVVTVSGWLVAGFGIGLAHSTSSVLAFSFAPKGREGEVSSSLQLAELFTGAISAGVGGALFGLVLAGGHSQREGVLSALILDVVLVLLSVAGSLRVGRYVDGVPPATR
ncbi:MAG: MFS transporter [Trueperaceae bacterium]|nr:MAG: MFS transporter [Trueperaceae bacterium]